MPQNYTGNPDAHQLPAQVPADGAAPVLALPVGTDVPSVSSIYQPLKVLADYLAFHQARAWQQKGVSYYNATRTYSSPDMVMYYVDGRRQTYIAKLGVDAFSGVAPPDADHWEKWYLTPEDLPVVNDLNSGMSTGYAMLGSGLKLQWEHLMDTALPEGTGHVDHVFASSFSSVCFFVLANVLNGVGDLTVSPTSATTCRISQRDSSNPITSATLISVGV